MEKIDKNDTAVDREGLGNEFVVGAIGCGVVDELVRDFDAYFRIGVPGAK